MEYNVCVTRIGRHRRGGGRRATNVEFEDRNLTLTLTLIRIPYVTTDM